uniref:Uncharacterized protein n=1 Tax=Trichogramma kaykai TaxID=54128 RepID=A0ABD2X341_9HYME
MQWLLSHPILDGNSSTPLRFRLQRVVIYTYEDDTHTHTHTHGFQPCIIEASAAAAAAAVASTHTRNIARYCHRRHSACIYNNNNNTLDTIQTLL